MADELKESGATATIEAPSYHPPDNEPQGLEPEKPAETPEPVKAGDTKAEEKPAVKLPPSIKPPVKTGRFQERISDLVSQRDTHKQEAERLRQELDRVKSGSSAATQPTAKPASESGLNPDDFSTYGEYIAALVENTIEKKTESQKTQQKQQEYAQQKQERMQAFHQHAEPLAQQYGDGFWDAITDPSLPITEAMADAVMELDNLGPYTMLYLATHREEAAKMAKMHPRTATIAIGRLAAQIDAELKQGAGESTLAEAAQAPSIQPNAMQTARPTPVPTIRGATPSLNAQEPNDKDSVDDWLRKETERLRRINPNARFYGAR